VDAVGEIAVRSRYLSPGYWRQPDLTQATFRPDPTGGPERLYLTGDLGRRLPDGCLVHLGRKDFQVKIRGFRVEVAEVEGALLSLPTIKEAVVVAREERPGEQRLVAYLVPTQRPAPTVSVLRRALAATLPDYMVPSAFVVVDTLPRTPAGKVDRRGLPAPERLRPSLHVPFASARTPLEERLAGIWAEVLGVDRVGIHDHFLDLGGQSLLATSLVSRVLTTFQVDLPLRTLFESPTVAEMALAIGQALADRLDPADLEHLQAMLTRRPNGEAEGRD
jgi:acyl carrier protein